MRIIFVCAGIVLGFFVISILSCQSAVPDCNYHPVEKASYAVLCDIRAGYAKAKNSKLAGGARRDAAAEACTLLRSFQRYVTVKGARDKYGVDLDRLRAKCSKLKKELSAGAKKRRKERIARVRRLAR